MPSFGIGASGHGRDYKLGYGLTVSQDGATHFDLGVYANRRESLGQGTAEHGVEVGSPRAGRGGWRLLPAALVARSSKV